MKFATSALFRVACLAALALLAIPALLAGSLGDLSHVCVLGMAAAAVSIDTPERAGGVFVYPIAAATKIYAGTLVALNATGYLVSASNTAGLRVMGRAEEEVDNSAGADGDLTAAVKAGTFRFANSGTNAVDPDDVGKLCFVEDNQTVSETGTNGVKAGRVVAVETAGVWVDTHYAPVVPVALVVGSTNGTAAAAADLAALKAETELLGDDTRAAIAALKAQGILL